MDPLPVSYMFEIFINMLADSEIVGYIVKDSLMGLLFAALGVYALFVRAGREVSGTRIIVLE